MCIMPTPPDRVWGDHAALAREETSQARIYGSCRAALCFPFWGDGLLGFEVQY